MPKHPNPGNFRNNPRRAAEAGRNGGAVSPGNFKYNPKRASDVAKLRRKPRITGD